VQSDTSFVIKVYQNKFAKSKIMEPRMLLTLTPETAMSSKDMNRDGRHNFAKSYLKAIYGIDNTENQSEVLYRTKKGGKCLILCGKSKNAWQAIRASNFDMMKRDDVIVYHNIQSGVTLSFFKHELFELNDAGFLNWGTTEQKEGGTVTRFLIQTKEVDGQHYLYLYAKGSNKITIKAQPLIDRVCKTGDHIGKTNLLFDGITLIRPNKN